MSPDAHLNVADHRDLVERMVRRYVSAEVLIVPDVGAWCEAHSRGSYTSAENGSPIGRALWNSSSEPNRILLRSRISKSIIIDQVASLYALGFRRALPVAEDAVEFLKHLVLHEVAHIRQNWGDDREKDCDRWAFNQLPRWRET